MESGHVAPVVDAGRHSRTSVDPMLSTSPAENRKLMHALGQPNSCYQCFVAKLGVSAFRTHGRSHSSLSNHQRQHQSCGGSVARQVCQMFSEKNGQCPHNNVCNLPVHSFLLLKQAIFSMSNSSSVASPIPQESLRNPLLGVTSYSLDARHVVGNQIGRRQRRSATASCFFEFRFGGVAKNWDGLKSSHLSMACS